MALDVGVEAKSQKIRWTFYQSELNFEISGDGRNSFQNRFTSRKLIKRSVNDEYIDKQHFERLKVDREASAEVTLRG